MKIKKFGKLNVTRETVRNLNEDALGAVAGGSMTSGTIQGGACCMGCGCIRSQACAY